MASITQLDRTIFELIRLELVRAGYLPDWRNISGTGAIKLENYQTALAGINSTQGGAIEVFGVGTGENRGQKDYNRITIDRKSIGAGASKNINTEGYEKQEDGSFLKFIYPDSTSVVDYEIRHFSQKTKWERIMIESVFKALGRKRHIKLLDSTTMEFTGDYILLEFTGAANVSATNSMEGLIGYRVDEIYLEEPQELAPIVPLTNIDACVLLSTEEE